MIRNEQRFRLSNEPGSLGVSCTDGGLALAGVPLLRKTEIGFQPRTSFEIQALMRRAYPRGIDSVRLMPGLGVVARSLNDGDLAKAMVATLLLRLPELDKDAAARVSLTDRALIKYPGQPRGWHQYWSTDKEDKQDNPDVATETDAAYQGTYHDIVVAELAAHWRSEGAKVITAVDLVARNGATARADLIVIPASGEPLMLVEVKTGQDPQYTTGQMIVYPMAQIGDHVYSPNAKIAALGFVPNQWLPPMAFLTIWKKDDKSPYSLLWNPDPVLKMMARLFVKYLAAR